MDVPLAAATPSPESSLGDSFGWPMRDPEWFSKIVVMGLISIIPIVGALQLFGWMLTALDNLRAGRQQLPPADFRYATRGVFLFLASLVWGLIIFAVLYGSMALVIFGLISVTPRTGGDNGSSAAPLVLFPLMFGWISAFGLVILLLYLFVPVVILYTDRTGFGGAFNIGGFIHAVRTSPKEAAAAGALALVDYFLSGLGTYLCYVGLLFTVPYSMAVLAGVLRWYEVHARPGALPVR